MLMNSQAKQHDGVSHCFYSFRVVAKGFTVGIVLGELNSDLSSISQIIISYNVECQSDI